MTNSKRTVITIDGLAASGKSTLAWQLAKKLGFAHVNTGLLYRAVAFLALQADIACDDAMALERILEEHVLSFSYSDEFGSRISLDGKDISDQLQSEEVADFTSKIAVLPELRAALRDQQQNVFPDKHIVAEGRDTGTVIFPFAEVKFFIEGDALIRAKRRAKDLHEKSGPADLSQVSQSVAEELRQRDERDRFRKVAPLMAPVDAKVIDNSQGELHETVQYMVEYVLSKLRINK